MNAHATFHRVSVIGPMMPGQLWQMLAELDRKAEWQRDIQDSPLSSDFHIVKAGQEIDSINQQITAIERELRERFASLFAGVPLRQLAERLS